MSTNRSTDTNNKSPGKVVPDSNPRPPSLSSSLRRAESATMSTDTAAPSASSRIRMADNGDWVPGRPLSQGASNFVTYLPQDEAVAAGLGGLDPVESQRVVDLLNRELTRLLKLNAREFWREVAGDLSLHEFLDSFLHFRSRWYDFPYHGAKGLVDGVIIGELDLNRRIFMVLYRISCNRDPGAKAADRLSQKDHAALLQDRKLLDLPKLLDICAIYGHGNEELTKSLIENAIRAQPWIHDSLSSMLSHFLDIVHTMHQRCISSLEAMFCSGKSEDHASSRLYTELLEVMDFLNDGVVSLNAFVAVYKPAAVYFLRVVETSYGGGDLLGTLARLHDSLLPSLQQGFQVMFLAGDNKLSETVPSLKLLSSRIVNFGWRLLDICYLSEEVFRDATPFLAATKMFPARVEDPVIRADILVQTFKEISGVSEHVQEIPNRNSFLKKIERDYQIMEKLWSLQHAGWISMENEQFQHVSDILRHSPGVASYEVRQPPVLPPVANNKELMDEDAAVKESKISQIKDLFPEYGNGFLAACLKAYNSNPEVVIQRILEGNLHEDLQQLDTSLEVMPPPKSASVLSGKDKGKGKLVDTTITLDGRQMLKHGQLQIGGPLVSASSSSSAAASSSAGKFMRKSKEDVPDKVTLDARNEKDAAKNAALISQYEYEDEYDDSFDDLGLSVVESRLEETEIFGDKTGATSGAESRGHSSSKWGSRKKPQFYVKDGKNYSYKVSGSVAVANADEAELVNKSQVELIHGLGRGGNIPLGAVKKLMEYNEEQNSQPDVSNMEGRESARNQRSWGRGGRGKQKESNKEQIDETCEASEGTGSHRGRGRGRGRGGGRNHHRKDRAIKKHFAGLTGI